MRIRRTASTAAVALLAAVLCACSQTDEPGAGPTKTPAGTSPGADSSQATPSAEPGETVAPSDPHPDAADLILSTSGLGPLTLGSPPDADARAGMVVWDPQACAGMQTEGDAGRWHPVDYDEDTSATGGQVRSFAIADVDGIVWIDVLGVGPHTEEGIRVGSTLTELQTAYPELQGPFDGLSSQAWWIENGNGLLQFETSAETGVDTVVIMRALALGGTPDFTAYQTGMVADGCE